jgi:SAM-dependent methyltransferase
MADFISDKLRRSTFLVRSVRTIRRTKMAWGQTAVELQEERVHNALIQRRQDLIGSYLRGNMVSKLQLGAGIYPLKGWLNSDIEPVANDIIYLDATEPFPFDDQTFDYIFAEHMIEHITYPQALKMLAEVGRVLKPGGKVRLATPDIRIVASLFEGDEAPLAYEYVETYARSLLGLYSPELSRFQMHEPRWRIDHQHMLTEFSDPGRDATCFVANLLFYGFGHQFLYDFPTLAAALRQNRFTSIVRLQPGESDDKHFRGIEQHGRRFSESINQFETLVVEAKR